MGGFRARNIRFCSVSDIGITEERLIWYFKLRHFLYIAVAAIFFASSSGSTIRLLIAVFLATIALIAALYPRKAISFEALLFGAFYFPFARRKETQTLKIDDAKLVTPRENTEDSSEKLEVRLDSEEFAEEILETEAGEYTRKAVEMKKVKVKKI